MQLAQAAPSQYSPVPHDAADTTTPVVSEFQHGTAARHQHTVQGSTELTTDPGVPPQIRGANSISSGCTRPLTAGRARAIQVVARGTCVAGGGIGAGVAVGDAAGAGAAVPVLAGGALHCKQRM